MTSRASLLTASSPKSRWDTTTPAPSESDGTAVCWGHEHDGTKASDFYLVDPKVEIEPRRLMRNSTRCLSMTPATDPDVCRN